MNAKLELAFFVCLGVIALVGIIWSTNTEKRLKRFFLGKKANNLEETLATLVSDIDRMKQAQESSQAEIAILQSKLRKSVRGLETIRFNPFPDQGSNQSFAIGMLNEDGDGVVISSLYSRERMSIFAKPINNHKSTYELSEEEKDAVTKAKVN